MVSSIRNMGSVGKTILSSFEAYIFSLNSKFFNSSIIAIIKIMFFEPSDVVIRESEIFYTFSKSTKPAKQRIFRYKESF